MGQCHDSVQAGTYIYEGGVSGQVCDPSTRLCSVRMQGADVRHHHREGVGEACEAWRRRVDESRVSQAGDECETRWCLGRQHHWAQAARSTPRFPRRGCGAPGERERYEID